MPEVVAAIDVGTNSVHMVVARSAPSGRFEVLTKTRRWSARLRGRRHEGALLRCDGPQCRCCAGTVCRHRQRGSTPKCSRLPPLRFARLNAAEFTRRALEEAGVTVNVISGIEEARLDPARGAPGPAALRPAAVVGRRGRRKYRGADRTRNRGPLRPIPQARFDPHDPGILRRGAGRRPGRPAVPELHPGAARSRRPRGGAVRPRGGGGVFGYRRDPLQDVDRPQGGQRSVRDDRSGSHPQGAEEGGLGPHRGAHGRRALRVAGHRSLPFGHPAGRSAGARGGL